MEAQDLERVPEAYRTEANQPLFDAHETYDSFIGDLLEKNGQVSTLSTELEAAKKGLEGTVRLPGEDATPEEISAYNKAIGVPESVDAYGIEGYDKTPGGKEYMQAMLSAGLTVKQAKDQLKAMESVKKAQDAQQTEANKAKIAAYKESLGDKADDTFALAQHGVDNFFPDAAIRENVSAQIMSNPDLIKAYAKIGAIIKEKPMIMSLGKGGNGGGNIYESMKGLE